MYVNALCFKYSQLKDVKIKHSVVSHRNSTASSLEKDKSYCEWMTVLIDYSIKSKMEERSKVLCDIRYRMEYLREKIKDASDDESKVQRLTELDKRREAYIRVWKYLKLIDAEFEYNHRNKNAIDYDIYYKSPSMFHFKDDVGHMLI